jgi:CheY-like chemotaxis protein
MPKASELTILVSGTVPSVIKYIDKEFKKAGCQTERVMESRDILSKVETIAPDVIVIDIQMENVSTYEVIEKVKALPKEKVHLALYSFFIDKDMAKESILHRLFASDTTHTHKNVKRPIKYLGIFNEDTFNNKIRTYLEKLTAH